MGVRDSKFAGLALPGLKRTGLLHPQPLLGARSLAEPPDRLCLGVLSAGPASPALPCESRLRRAAREGRGAVCSQPLGSFLPSWATPRVSSISG